MVASISNTQVNSLEYSTANVQSLNLFGSFNSLPQSPLFGTDGIRGKVGELLTAPFALQVGFWAGKVLSDSASQPGPIILGQDSRNSSDMLAMAITAGLTAAGVEVWNLGLCPTPCVAYLTRATKAIGGIMISASHNPPEDNGIKFFGINGLKLTHHETAKIESGLRGCTTSSTISPNLAQSWGKHYHRASLINDYLQSLLLSLPTNTNFAKMRIVLDLAWGASVNLAPLAFSAMGAEVICLHNQPDGDRINVNCGSTHLESLQAAVKNYDADLGFAFDGDADRVMAVDGKGRIVNGDYILYLWGKQLQKEQKLPDNLIVATVMANLGFEQAWRKLGGDFIRTAVGDQNVQAQMWETGAMLGGEQSGHILCHHHSFSGDGLQTALHLTALTSEEGLSLSELLAQSFATYPQILRNIRVEDRDRRLNWQECEPLQNAIVQAESAMRDQGRILVRASGTEPLIRVMVEAINEELAHHWSEYLANQVSLHFAF